MSNHRRRIFGHFSVNLLAIFDAVFGRFLLVGLSNFCVSFGVFQGLLLIVPTSALAVSYSQFTSYSAGVAWSYFWNRRFTFHSHAPATTQLIRFVLVQILLAIASSVAIGLCVDVIGWTPTLSWFVVMAGITLVNFLVSKYWVFRSQPINDHDAPNPDAG